MNHFKFIKFEYYWFVPGSSIKLPLLFHDSSSSLFIFLFDFKLKLMVFRSIYAQFIHLILRRGAFFFNSEVKKFDFFFFRWKYKSQTRHNRANWQFSKFFQLFEVNRNRYSQSLRTIRGYIDHLYIVSKIWLPDRSSGNVICSITPYID